MNKELNEVAKEIRDLLEQRRQELSLTFVEDTHTYYMKDVDGVVRDAFPSVSKVIKYFYDEFDSEGISLKKAQVTWKFKKNYWTNGRLPVNMLPIWVVESISY